MGLGDLQGEREERVRGVGVGLGDLQGEREERVRGVGVGLGDLQGEREERARGEVWDWVIWEDEYDGGWEDG